MKEHDMNEFEMKEEYYLGIENIDKQHAKLLGLMKEADELLRDENMLYKDEDISKILSGIKEYVHSHFIDEENFMAEIGYQGLEEHKKLHQEFAVKVDEFDSHVAKLSLGTQDSMLLELLNYLRLWLQNHICETDRKYAESVQ